MRVTAWGRSDYGPEQAWASYPILQKYMFDRVCSAHNRFCASSSCREDLTLSTPPRSQFILVLWRRVLTPFQAARIAIAAYPSVDVDLDMLAVIKCADARTVVGACCLLRRNTDTDLFHHI